MRVISSIKKYRTLVKVVEMGSLTRAAEELGYTQSGVSHILNSLEEELGFTLLLRNRSGVRLTEDGAKVLPAIRNIVNSSEQLQQIISSIRGLDSGLVRIGTFSSVAVHWLPGMIKEFQAEYPQIEIRLLSGDYHDIEQWLADGAVDIGFISLPSEVACNKIPLQEDRLLALLPQGHPLAQQERFPIAAAAEQPLISLLKSSDQDLRRTLESAGVTPNIRYSTKDDYAIIAMVEQGLGISIMPELLLQGRTANLCVRELDPPAHRTIALGFTDAAAKSPATAKFIDHVCTWVKSRA